MLVTFLSNVRLGKLWFFFGDLLEDLGDLLDCDLGSRMNGLVVLVVTDVLVSLSSVVTEFCDGVSLKSDWVSVEPQSSSFSKKAIVCLGDFAGRDEI